MFDWLRAQMPWSVIVIFLIILILYIWVWKGNAIFHWRFYSNHYPSEIEEIEVPKDIADRILGTAKTEGRAIKIEGKIVKRKIRKKRFEL